MPPYKLGFVRSYFSQLSTILNVVFTWLGFAEAPARQSPARWWSESDEWFALHKNNISYITEFFKNDAVLLHTLLYLAVFRIRICKIRKFLDLPDPYL